MDFFQVISFLDNEICSYKDDGKDYGHEEFEKDVKNHIKSSNLIKLYELLVEFLSELIFKEYIKEIEVNKYFSIIQDIKDIVYREAEKSNTSNCEEVSEENLRKILSCSIKQRMKQRSLCDRSINNLKRDKMRFDSFFFFKNKISDLELELDNRFEFNYFDNIDGIKQIQQYIESLISDIGAEEVLFFIYDKLFDNYHGDLQIFTISKPSTGQIKDSEPEVPYGYLINLCIKQIYRVKKTRKHLSDNDLEQINYVLDVALRLGLLLDLTAYNSFSVILRDSIKVDRNLLNQLLYENAAYDSIFMFDQYPAKSISYLIRNVFQGVEHEIQFDIPIEVIAKVIDAIVDLFVVEGKTRKILTMSENKLCREIIGREKSLAKKDVKKFLDIFSKDISETNLGFSHPLDYEKINAHFAPVLKVDASRYMVMNPSIFSLSYFSILRHNYIGKSKLQNGGIGGSIDQKVTRDNFEKLIRKIFIEKGFRTYKGRFGNGNEADLVVDTDNRVYVIECKIGTFARKAKALDMMELYSSLDVLFKSQRQAYTVEYYLKKYGSIEFDDNGFKNRLYLGRKSVVRISLSLYDYLGFQDMTFVSYLLMELYGVQLSLKEKKERYIKIIDRLNENLNAITNYLNDIAEVNKSKGRTNALHLLTCNSLFLCFGHLYLWLMFANNPNDFDDLLPLVYTSGSQNFYCELKESLLLKERIELRDGEKRSEKIFFNKRDAY